MEKDFNCRLDEDARTLLARAGDNDNGSDVRDKCLILLELYRRHTRYQKTQLRDVHRVTGIVQPRALRILRALESAELIEITSPLHDAFAALIKLRPMTIRAIERTLAENSIVTSPLPIRKNLAI